METVKARLVSESKNQRVLTFRFDQENGWKEWDVSIRKSESSYANGSAEIEERMLLHLEKEFAGKIERP